MRLVPRTLFGRTLLVLAAGLLLAQAASVVLNLFDRGSAVYRLTATQIAARIAQNARILNRLPPGDRHHVLEAVDGRHLRVHLAERLEPLSKGYAEHDPYETLFLEALRAQLGAPWTVSVEITTGAAAARRAGRALAGKRAGNLAGAALSTTCCRPRPTWSPSWCWRTAAWRCSRRRCRRSLSAASSRWCRNCSCSSWCASPSRGCSST